MKSKFMAWDKEFKIMSRVTRIDYRADLVELSDGEPYLQGFSRVELMRSTGLFDKNGKEIFEGDIVKTTRFFGRADEIGGFYEYDKELIGIVKVLEGAWVIDTGNNAVRLWTEIEENEILGNVYENKELLEEKE